MRSAFITGVFVALIFYLFKFVASSKDISKGKLCINIYSLKPQGICTDGDLSTVFKPSETVLDLNIDLHILKIECDFNLATTEGWNVTVFVTNAFFLRHKYREESYQCIFDDELYYYKCDQYKKRFVIFDTDSLIDDVTAYGTDSYYDIIVGCFLPKEKIKSLYIFAVQDVEGCLIFCSKVFIGIKSGGHCFCFTDLTNFNPVDLNKCDKLCESDSGMCGGDLTFSIYSKENMLEREKKGHINCMDIYGFACETCACGWDGNSCWMRNCFENNGNCGIHNCIFISNDKYEFSMCKCQSGYIRFSQSGECEDIDECFITNMCDSPTTDCFNTQGSYGCSCKLGYVQLNEYSCDIPKECNFAHQCDLISTICKPTIYGHKCICLEGFSPTSQSIIRCEDVNECGMKLDMCVGGAKCVNTIGSYDCVCDDGMEKRKSLHSGDIFCDDVNECIGESVCDLLTSFCLNRLGGYDCFCLEGFLPFNNVSCAKDYDLISNSTTAEDYSIELTTLEILIVNKSLYFIPFFLASLLGLAALLAILSKPLKRLFERRMVGSRAGSIPSPSLSKDSISFE